MRDSLTDSQLLEKGCAQLMTKGLVGGSPYVRHFLYLFGSIPVNILVVHSDHKATGHQPRLLSICHLYKDELGKLPLG